MIYSINKCNFTTDLIFIWKYGIRMKQLVRLTESDLHDILRDIITYVINEGAHNASVMECLLKYKGEYMKP